MSALTPQIGLLIQNDSGMVIPPRSVVVVTSMETTVATSNSDSISICHVNQYGCGKPGNILVTGPAQIAIGKKGQGFVDQLIYVSIDGSISDPAPGEEWGPADGSWVLTRSNSTKGFFAQGHSANGGIPKRSMFLRTFVRAPASVCSSSSSSAASNSGSSVSGSSSSSAACGCVTVVTSVSCSGGSLSVTYGSARGCC